MDWWRQVDEDLDPVPHAVIGAAASNAYMAPAQPATLTLPCGTGIGFAQSSC
jgi:hypothetical protein